MAGNPGHSQGRLPQAESLQFLPNQCPHSLLPRSRVRRTLRGKRNALPFQFVTSHLVRPRASLVPRNINVVHHGLGLRVDRISPRIRQHARQQTLRLLRSSHRPRRLLPLSANNHHHHPPLPPIVDVPARMPPHHVRLRPRRNFLPHI